jgi:hypothetical protein
LLLIAFIVALLLLVGASLLLARSSGLASRVAVPFGTSQSVVVPTPTAADSSAATFSRTDLEIHESDYCQCQR